MEKCFDGFAELGLHGTGIRTPAKQKFFKGLNERYTEYAKSLEPKLGIPHEKITPLIFILIRTCVHYSLFEDEFYMKSQIAVLKETLELFVMKYNPKAIQKED